MASATASNMIRGQSLKSHFVPIWVLALLVWSFNFFKELHCLCKIKKIYSTNPSNWSNSVQGIADLNNKQHFFEKLSKLCINRANSIIGIKCDFRDWPRITLEAVADAFFHLVFPQKYFMWTCSPQRAHFNCLKTYEQPCIYREVHTLQYSTVWDINAHKINFSFNQEQLKEKVRSQN